SASPRVTDGLKDLAAAQWGVAKVNELLTMHLAPRQVLVNLSIDFDPKLSSDQVELAVTQLETRMRDAFPEVTRVFVEAQSWAAHPRRTQADAAGSAAYEPAPPEGKS
ncbi:MAG: cation transporter, partial [Kiloniellales bacterium]|nr:cation transporter [Kiloniellales bacterium]